MCDLPVIVPFAVAKRSSSAPIIKRPATVPSLSVPKSPLSHQSSTTSAFSSDSISAPVSRLDILRADFCRTDLIYVISRDGANVELECHMPAMAKSMAKYIKAYVVALDCNMLRRKGAGVGLKADRAARKKLMAEDCQCAPRQQLKQDITPCSMKLAASPCNGGEARVWFQIVVEAVTDASFWSVLNNRVEIEVPVPDAAAMVVEQDEFSWPEESVPDLLESLSKCMQQDVTKARVSNQTMIADFRLLQNAVIKRGLMLEEMWRQVGKRLTNEALLPALRCFIDAADARGLTYESTSERIHKLFREGEWWLRLTEHLDDNCLIEVFKALRDDARRRGLDVTERAFRRSDEVRILKECHLKGQLAAVLDPHYRHVVKVTLEDGSTESFQPLEIELVKALEIQLGEQLGAANQQIAVLQDAFEREQMERRATEQQREHELKLLQEKLEQMERERQVREEADARTQRERLLDEDKLKNKLDRERELREEVEEKVETLQKSLREAEDQVEWERNLRQEAEEQLERQRKLRKVAEEQLGKEQRSRREAEEQVEREHNSREEAEGQVEREHKLLEEAEGQVEREHKLRKEAEEQMHREQHIRQEAERQAEREHKLLEEAEGKVEREHKLLEEAEEQVVKEHKLLEEAEGQAEREHKLREEAEGQAQREHKLREEAEEQMEREQKSRREVEEQMDREQQSRQAAEALIEREQASRREAEEQMEREQKSRREVEEQMEREQKSLLEAEERVEREQQNRKETEDQLERERNLRQSAEERIKSETMVRQENDEGMERGQQEGLEKFRREANEQMEREQKLRRETDEQMVRERTTRQEAEEQLEKERKIRQEAEEEMKKERALHKEVDEQMAREQKKRQATEDKVNTLRERLKIVERTLEEERRSVALDQEERAKAEEEKHQREVTKIEDAERKRLAEADDEHRRKQEPAEGAERNRVADEEEQRVNEQRAEKKRLANDEVYRLAEEVQKRRLAEDEAAMLRSSLAVAEEARRRLEEEARLRQGEDAMTRRRTSETDSDQTRWISQTEASHTLSEEVPWGADEKEHIDEAEAKVLAEEDDVKRKRAEWEAEMGARRTRLRVKVLSAHHLPVGDVDGFSDPYVVVKLLTQHEDAAHPAFKTDTKRKTLDPEWNQEHIFDACCLSDKIMFEVFDHDDGKKDDNLASVILTGSDFRPGGFHNFLHLCPKKQKSHGIHAPSIFRSKTGKVKKTGGEDATLEVEIEVLPMLKIPNEPRCFLKILSGHDLRPADRNGLADPYCIIEIVGKPASKYKTTIKKKTLNPIWLEERELKPFAAGDDIHIQVWDHDLGKRLGDPQGTLTLRSSSFFPNGFEGNVSLQGKGAIANSRLHLAVDIY